MNILVNKNGETVSILVKKIGDVIEASEVDFHPPLKALTSSIHQLTRDAYKLLDGQLMIIDVEKSIGIDAVS